nr:PREDICTED: zinc finger protein 425-like isoform X1 [Bemisia tabaci]
MIDNPSSSQKCTTSSFVSGQASQTPCKPANDSSVYVQSNSFSDSPLNVVNSPSNASNSKIQSLQISEVGTRDVWNDNINAPISQLKNNYTTNSSSNELDSVNDSSTGLFICQLKGSPPKIQRIFTTYPRSFIETAFTNSILSEIEYVDAKHSQELINKLLPFEQASNSRQELISDERDVFETESSCEDFNHFVEVIETYEEPHEDKSSLAIFTASSTHQDSIKSSVGICKKPCKKQRLRNNVQESSKVGKVSREGKKAKFKTLQPSQLYQYEGTTEDAVLELPKPVFECDTCHNTFSSKYSLRDHILAKHPPSNNPSDNRPFQCEKCAQSFVRKSYLNEHLQMAHSDQPRQQCPLCPKKFKRKQYLDYHTVRVHSDSKPHLCQHCGEHFSLASALNEHVRYHHSDGFKCSDCGRVFKRPKHLLVHSKPRVQGLKPTCRYCKETFINKCSLQMHVQSMHSDLYQFSCTECNMKFTLRRTLVSHVRHVHGASRNHPCPICDKTFKNATAVKVHMSNVHNNSRNFKCGLCDRSYKTRQVYNEHMAFQHPI